MPSKRLRGSLGAVALCAIAGLASAADETGLTIYSSAQPGAIPAELYRPTPPSRSPYGYGFRPYQPVPGYAVVRHDRTMDLLKGRGVVKFTDVAALLDPTTVSFASLSDPSGTRVVEQNYQFDLVSTEKLLEKYIDQQITVVATRGNDSEIIAGRLLSSAPGQVVLAYPSGEIRVVAGYTGLALPSLPAGLLTRPTLIWGIDSDTGGRQDVRVAYQTEGITWWADYNLTFTEGANANQGTLDVGAWVSILNQSGATYENARLKLVAGDVNRVARPPEFVGGPYPASRAAGTDQGGFEEKAFFEYHLYTLGRPTTIPDNSTKQIELFEAARGVACDKVLVYDGLGQGFMWGGGGPATDAGFGSQSNKEVDVYLRFRNSQDRGMGMPLPAGRIRVSKLDPADKSLEFIGEDSIRHTPKDEDVLVKLGRAFDVVGERRQVDFRVDHARREMVETVEVSLRNHKTERVTVIAQERMFRWLTWEIVRSSEEGKKIDARTMHWSVTLDPDASRKITYTVRYTW